MDQSLKVRTDKAREAFDVIVGHLQTLGRALRAKGKPVDEIPRAGAYVLSADGVEIAVREAGDRVVVTVTGSNRLPSNPTVALLWDPAQGSYVREAQAAGYVPTTPAAFIEDICTDFVGSLRDPANWRPPGT